MEILGMFHLCLGSKIMPLRKEAFHKEVWDMHEFYTMLGIFSLLFLIAINVFLFFSIIRQGDERRKMIVEKAGSNTFMITAVYLVYCVAEGVIKSFTEKIPIEEKNPFIILTAMSIIYFVQLLYFKKKYGAGYEK